MAADELLVMLLTTQQMGLQAHFLKAAVGLEGASESGPDAQRLLYRKRKPLFFKNHLRATLVLPTGTQLSLPSIQEI